MFYDILEESGLVKVINVVEKDDYAVQVKGARSHFVPNGMTPFYATIFKNELGGYVELVTIQFEDLEELYENFDKKEVKDMPVETKKKLSRELREKVVVLPDIDHHFREKESPENRSIRDSVEAFYAKMPDEMSWVEKNKRFLYKLSDILGLPRFSYPGMPDYELDRPLEPEEVKDFVENKVVVKDALGKELNEFWNKDFKTELTG